MLSPSIQADHITTSNAVNVTPAEDFLNLIVETTIHWSTGPISEDSMNLQHRHLEAPSHLLAAAGLVGPVEEK